MDCKKKRLKTNHFNAHSTLTLGQSPKIKTLSLCKIIIVESNCIKLTECGDRYKRIERTETYLIPKYLRPQNQIIINAAQNNSKVYKTENL